MRWGAYAGHAPSTFDRSTALRVRSGGVRSSGIERARRFPRLSLSRSISRSLPPPHPAPPALASARRASRHPWAEQAGVPRQQGCAQRKRNKRTHLICGYPPFGGMSCTGTSDGGSAICGRAKSGREWFKSAPVRAACTPHARCVSRATPGRHTREYNTGGSGGDRPRGVGRRRRRSAAACAARWVHRKRERERERPPLSLPSSPTLLPLRSVPFFVDRAVVRCGTEHAVSFRAKNERPRDESVDLTNRRWKRRRERPDVAERG